MFMSVCVYVDLMAISVFLVDVTMMDLLKNKNMKMMMMMIIHVSRVPIFSSF
jgi:hypothetical protein